MAQRIEKFSTVAAVGASSVVVPHSFLDGTVTRVELYVPDGHAGFTSWRFFYGLAQLIPFTVGATIVANSRQFEWDLEDAPTGQLYRSVVSNSDVFSHSFHVEVWIDELTTGGGDDFADFPVLVLPSAL